MDNFDFIPQQVLENPVSQVIISISIAYWIMKRADANTSDEVKEMQDNDISKTYKLIAGRLHEGDERISRIIELSSELTKLIKEIEENE